MRADGLDPDLSRLLRAEARFDDDPEERRERVLSAVHAAVAAQVVDTQGARATTAGTTSAGPRSVALVRAAIAPALGVVLGAALSAVFLWPRADRVFDGPRPVSKSSASAKSESPNGPRDETMEPPSPPSMVETIDPAPVAVPVARRDEAPRPRLEDRAPESEPAPTVQPIVPEPPPLSLLRDEQRILDGARAALARDDARAAFEAIERHAEQHPAGILAEERDALRLIALARAGLRDRARVHHERFRSRYPQSPLLPRIDAELAANR
jgi:hypothetical protein